MSFINGLFTSESVSDGHPDKFCDQVSDAVLDACLWEDPYSRVAAECAVKGHQVWVFGEITTKTKLNVPDIVRQVARDIGHIDGRWGFDPDHLNIREDLSIQSPQIATKVDTGGAGDQGIMFGYACDETPELLPAPIAWAHRLLIQQKKVRGTAEGAILGPDAKSQVTVEYVDGRPSRIRAVVLSTQHSPEAEPNRVRDYVIESIIRPALPAAMTDNAELHINPGGDFILGGPAADAGLTGRKIIVDTYGGFAKHGGGAFSGKDATKVDRSAAYAARQLAREVVSRGAARHCEVRLAYAIGLSEPVAVSLETFGTGPGLPETLGRRDLFTPASICERLELRKPIFRQTSAFGHFGRSDFPWEAGIRGLGVCQNHGGDA